MIPDCGALPVTPSSETGLEGIPTLEEVVCHRAYQPWKDDGLQVPSR